MGNYSIVLIILAFMISLSAVAERIKLPYPVLLVLGGVAIGFIPWLPNISLDPEIVVSSGKSIQTAVIDQAEGFTFIAISIF